MIGWLAGEALVHLAAATAFAGLAALAARAAGRAAPAALRHAVYTAAAGQFLLPFGLLAGLGRMLGRMLPAAAPPVAIADFSALARYGAGAGAVAEPGSATAAALAGLWGAGTLVCSVLWLRHAGRRWRLRPLDARAAAALRAAAARLGFRGRVRAGVTRETGTPAAAGILRPVVLLPEGFSARLGTAELEAVLMHELAHVRRRDNLTGAAVRLAACVFWFHPLVWWLERRALAEREFAADEMVVAGGVAAPRYAAGILAACRFSVQRTRAGAAAASGSDLKRRMERIMSRERAVPVTGRARALLLAAAALVPGTPLAAGLWAGLAAPSQTLEARQGGEFLKAELVPALGVRVADGEALAALAALFSPSWTPPTHLGNWGKWLAEDAAYIIAPEERREFLSLTSDAEREAFIVRFWQRRGQAVKVEHYRRIAYANARFGTRTAPGWRTDRGRLYIVLGPPDEIEMHWDRALEIWFYRSFGSGARGLRVQFRTP